MNPVSQELSPDCIPYHITFKFACRLTQSHNHALIIAPLALQSSSLSPCLPPHLSLLTSPSSPLSLTQIPDYLSLDELVTRVGSVLVVGGGFLGSELAVAVASRGEGEEGWRSEGGKGEEGEVMER